MDSVKVALRVRPLVASEIELGCRTCVQRVPEEPQITIGKSNQMFTYNFVFDETEGQGKVYEVAVKPLIDNLFKGYNVTILAYGQTGSGKTYTMGTNYAGEGELGVIPRAVYEIFDRISSIHDQEFRVTTSFIELYNESLFDLLTERPREQSIVEMREYGNTICIPGLSELAVSSPEETLERLKAGSKERVVGSTAMNAQSSRSHAIFTVNIKIIPKENRNKIMTSKFHLVDLAGSERSKKTGTTGDRFKEGVNINKGLLVLGNVISQLGEGNQGFINYRDSKLTRLLQDSLGGNSVTLMIACISPADYNQEETLSTLRYADRARKIKNKPIVNQDPIMAEMIRLRKENEDLKLKMIRGGTASECPPEHNLLQMQLVEAHKKVNQLSKALSENLIQKANMYEKALSVENAENTFKEKLGELEALSESMVNDDPISLKLKEKINEIKMERKKVEDEILSFDKNDGQEDDGKDGREDEDEEGDAQRREELIISQSKMSKELRDLTKNLMWKEELVAKLTENTGQLDRMKGVSQATVDDLKRQLAELQREREDLIRQQSRATTTSQNSAKVAETRRKRLQELENINATLRKKLCEQERVLKMKDKSDEKILNLKQEIMSMKQMKVRLIQQMKAENEKFKAFKAVKDKEVCQLRTQNIKRQNQLKKMEQMHTLQQNVLRRKLEAAAAANKRIMAVIERQRAAKEKRSKGPASEKIKERMAEELELLESEYQAQKSLENLLQDRACLTKEMVLIKESLEDKNVSQKEKQKLRDDLKQVEQELELRSAEISDLQQKLFDLNQDDHRGRNTWDSLQSMADAKFALSYLFELLSEKVKEHLATNSILSELKDYQAETDQQILDYQSQLERMEAHHKERLERMEKECEEKVYLFLKLVSENFENSNQAELSEDAKAQMREFKERCLLQLEKLDELREKIAFLESEKVILANNTSKASSSTAFEKCFEEKMNTTFVMPSSKLGKRSSSGGEKCDCDGTCMPDCLCAQSSSPCNQNCTCDQVNCYGGPKKPRRFYFEDDDENFPASNRKNFFDEDS